MKKKIFDTTEYTYYQYDPILKRNVPIRLVAGQDGVTEEHIMTLREMDESERLANNREERHRDMAFEKQKAAVDDDGNTYDPFDILVIPESEETNSDIADKTLLLEKLMERLTEKQIKLIYEIYGLNKGFTEIAREQGVTEGAIRNRNSKIKARLKKLFEEEEKK